MSYTVLNMAPTHSENWEEAASCYIRKAYCGFQAHLSKQNTKTSENITVKFWFLLDFTALGHRNP